MDLKLIERPDVLLSAALSRGRKAGSLYPEQKRRFYTLKGKEIAKIDKSAEYLIDVLEKTVTSFPSIDTLDPFNRELFECIINVDEVRKALSSLMSVARIIKKLRIQKIIALKEMKYDRENNEVSDQKVFAVTNSYIGRLSSLVKGLKDPIEVYNDSTNKLRELPRINPKEEAYLFAGFPNVGKSTLMRKITDSKPKVAPYPFTTQGLNVGHFIRKHLPVQVIDTPGLLDRPLNERNAIELKAIAAFQYLKGIMLFVVDPLDDIAKQKNLFLETKKLFSDKKFIIIINKTDISRPEQIEIAKTTFEGQEIILEGNGLNNLKEKVIPTK